MDEFKPGTYECISIVNIRREPKIGLTNIKGKLSVGTQRTIYSVITDNNNMTWGRVSLADSAGISEWVCIREINRKFMKFIEPLPPIFETSERLEKLIAWAKTKGFVE